MILPPSVSLDQVTLCYVESQRITSCSVGVDKPLCVSPSKKQIISTPSVSVETNSFVLAISQRVFFQSQIC